MHHVKKALEEIEFSQFQSELDEAFKVYRAAADEKKASKPATSKKSKKKEDKEEAKDTEEAKESEEGDDHGSDSS